MALDESADDASAQAQEHNRAKLTRRTMVEGVRILVVEDDAAINKVVTSYLGKFGAVCTAAFSGSEGLLCLEAQPFDLVVTDLMLPGAAALEPYTLFGQFSALAQGGVPEAGTLLFAGFVAVASAAAAVVVFRRREPGRRHGPLPECRRHRRHVLGNPELLSPLCDPVIAILSAVPRPLKMAKLSPLLSSSSIVIPSYTQRWYNWV